MQMQMQMRMQMQMQMQMRRASILLVRNAACIVLAVRSASSARRLSGKRQRNRRLLPSLKAGPQPPIWP